LSYLFEDFSLDSGRRELRRGAALIPVEPLVFDLLEFLIRSRDRVVSKDDLITSVWNGRIVSESTLTSRMNAARHALGDNGEQQRLIRTIPRKGFRFVGEVREGGQAPDTKAGPAPSIKDRELSADASQQSVTFCRTQDSANIAVASMGSGPTLVRTPFLITHIEYDWQHPFMAPLMRRLAQGRRVVRYDGRGTGMSGRNVPEITPTTFLLDLEAVIASLNVECVALLGMSGGVAAAVAYAARHPQRVSRLVLYGGYAQGRNKRGSAKYADEAQAFYTMLRSGWGDAQSPFWRAFNSFYLPNGTPEEHEWLMQYHRTAASTEDSLKLRKAVDDIDVLELASKVTAPTIVFHCLRDTLVPFEQAQLLAASIPGARFVALDSENHVLASHDPAWAKFVSEMEAFLNNST
jgi:DNA-binding winged helix-turn-helix (wHTH) protein/pimeloyl-ACP methyl ester carboxylesterase